MTSNQIALRNVKNEEAKLEEEKRHNLVTEGYTSEHYERQDRASLQQAEAATSQAATAAKQLYINQINAETQRYQAETGRLSYLESARHNVVSESLQFQQLSEQQRHNLVGESQQWTSLSEQRRHNQAGESISWYQSQEAARHNLATESEAVRHNVASETLSRQQLEESARHNKQQESIGYLQARTAQDVAAANKAIGWATVGANVANNVARNSNDAERNRIQDEYNTRRLDIESAYNTRKLDIEAERVKTLKMQALKPGNSGSQTVTNYYEDDGYGRTGVDMLYDLHENLTDNIDSILTRVVNFFD